LHVKRQMGWSAQWERKKQPVSEKKKKKGKNGDKGKNHKNQAIRRTGPTPVVNPKGKGKKKGKKKGARREMKLDPQKKKGEKFIEPGHTQDRQRGGARVAARATKREKARTVGKILHKR